MIGITPPNYDYVGLNCYFLIYISKPVKDLINKCIISHVCGIIDIVRCPIMGIIACPILGSFFVIGGINMKENMIFTTLQEKINILFTEQQKEAVLHLTGPCLVLAVPGSGKTSIMLARTASLILNNKVAPQEILSLTYNKSMANAMKKTFTQWFPKLDNEHLTFGTISDFAHLVIREYEINKNISFTLI